MTYKNLQQHNLTAQFYLKFLLITEHEVPFMYTETQSRTEKQMNTEQYSANFVNR